MKDRINLKTVSFDYGLLFEETECIIVKAKRIILIHGFIKEHE